MKKIFVILIVVGLGFSSCDRINDPYKGLEKPIDELDDDSIVSIDTLRFCTYAKDDFDIELNDTTYNDTTSNIRKVLLEEFTGHLCGFCPPQSKKLIAKTENELKGKTVVMSIHAANFAVLVPSKGYTTDFTTSEGNDLHEKYKGGNTAPSLMLNRSNNPASASKWDGLLDSLDKSGYYNDPVVKFKVRNIYNATIKKGRADIDIEFLKDFSGVNFVLGVYITEDNIIAMQKWYNNPTGPDDIEDYDHRHAIRTAATPTFGASFVSGTVSVNQKESRSFCYDMKDEWKADNCSVVVFLANADNNEIFQAEEVHLKHE